MNSRSVTNIIRARNFFFVRPLCLSRKQEIEKQMVIDHADNSITDPLEYKDRVDEDVKKRRARLMYQSRKRGMLENGLLLSTFAAKYLNKFTEEQLAQYDRLINKPSNDWDIFYWAIGTKPTPEIYDNDIMKMLKEHAKNMSREQRVMQPDLY